MKFLIALSVLASSSVFANDLNHKIKCWETAQEHGGKPAYVFEVRELTNLGRFLQMVYPVNLGIKPVKGCLFGFPTAEGNKEHVFEACPGEGQDIRGLVPIDVEERFNGEYVGTVYCEEEIEDWFDRYDPTVI